MTNLLIDNRDTLAHIDTYQMLTGESWQESDLDDYNMTLWELEHETYSNNTTITPV